MMPQCIVCYFNVNLCFIAGLRFAISWVDNIGIRLCNTAYLDVTGNIDESDGLSKFIIEMNYLMAAYDYCNQCTSSISFLGNCELLLCVFDSLLPYYLCIFLHYLIFRFIAPMLSSVHRLDTAAALSFQYELLLLSCRMNIKIVNMLIGGVMNHLVRVYTCAGVGISGSLLHPITISVNNSDFLNYLNYTLLGRNYGNNNNNNNNSNSHNNGDKRRFSYVQNLHFTYSIRTRCSCLRRSFCASRLVVRFLTVLGRCNSHNGYNHGNNDNNINDNNDVVRNYELLNILTSGAILRDNSGYYTGNHGNGDNDSHNDNSGNNNDVESLISISESEISLNFNLLLLSLVSKPDHDIRINGLYRLEPMMEQIMGQIIAYSQENLASAHTCFSGFNYGNYNSHVDLIIMIIILVFWILSISIIQTILIILINNKNEANNLKNRLHNDGSDNNDMDGKAATAVPQSPYYDSASTLTEGTHKYNDGCNDSVILNEGVRVLRELIMTIMLRCNNNNNPDDNNNNAYVNGNNDVSRKDESLCVLISQVTLHVSSGRVLNGHHNGNDGDNDGNNSNIGNVHNHVITVVVNDSIGVGNNVDEFSLIPLF